MVTEVDDVPGTWRWSRIEDLPALSDGSRYQAGGNEWRHHHFASAPPRITVSRVDVDRAGPTYTIDTLRDVQRLNPDADLYFITGADAIAQILSWRNHDELWELAHFVAVSRPGHVLNTDGLPVEDVSQLEIPALAISSTDCRGRVRGGHPVWYLVPDGVVQYIAKHHLYRSNE